MDLTATLQGIRQLRDGVRERNPPPEEGAPSPEEPVIYLSLVRNTRHYLERLAHQINGAYAGGWYDASAVMIRRLVETLIIEVYEKYKIESSVQNASGDFFYLRDLVAAMLAEKAWNLGRTTKGALPRLKDVGDRSAHSRRYVAQRQDIDKLIDDLRIVVQELVTLADLKR